MNRKNTDMRKIAIYSRKSKFTGKGESIANQIEICKAKIYSSFTDVTENDIVIFEDEGFSGGNTKRPQFQKMMSAIKNNELRAVVSYRLDRISRNVADFANMYEIFKNMNVAYISASESYDTSTPTGVAMMNMATVFAQLERETIAERIRDNMHELAKGGRWLGGRTPTGYKSTEIIGSITVDGKKHKAYKLDIIKDEAELVGLIFRKFLETNSLTKVETFLLQNKINTKNDKEFTRFAIKGILQNPVYMIADDKAFRFFEMKKIDIYSDKESFDGKHGIMAYNKTIQKVGRTNQMRDMSEWIIAVGKHTGLISGADWIKVQELLEQNRSKSYRKSKSNVALLSGLLFCGNCGSFMRPKLSKRLNADGEEIYNYLCETKEKSRMHNCAMKNPNGNALDKAICDEIKKLSEDSSDFIIGLEKAKQTFVGSFDEIGEQLEKLSTKLLETDREIKKLVSSLSQAEGTAALEYITDRINELHENKNGFQKQIDDLKAVTEKHELTDLEFDLLKDLVCSFSASFETMSVEEKRAALRMFISRIIWDGENVHLYLHGSNDEDEEPQGEDRKRNPHVLPKPEEECSGHVNERPY